LRKTLQTFKAIEDDPDRARAALSRVHKTNEQRVQPQTNERAQTLADLSPARQKEPAITLEGPIGGAPPAHSLALRREKTKSCCGTAKH
jgi:hypothetical protein